MCKRSTPPFPVEEGGRKKKREKNHDAFSSSRGERAAQCNNDIKRVGILCKNVPGIPGAL